MPGWMCGAVYCPSGFCSRQWRCVCCRSICIHLVIAGGGCGLSGAVEGDQALIHQGISDQGGSGGRRRARLEQGEAAIWQRRYWRHDPGMRLICGGMKIISSGFHPYQSGETRVGAAGSGLAVVEFSPAFVDARHSPNFPTHHTRHIYTDPPALDSYRPIG